MFKNLEEVKRLISDGSISIIKYSQPYATCLKLLVCDNRGPSDFAHQVYETYIGLNGSEQMVSPRL